MTLIKSMYFVERNDWIAVIWVIFAHAIVIVVLMFGQSLIDINKHTNHELPIILITNAMLNSTISNSIIPVKTMPTKISSTPLNLSKLNKNKQYINKSLSKSLVSKPIVPKPSTRIIPLQSNISNQLTHTTKYESVILSATKLSPIINESIKPTIESPTISKLTKNTELTQPIDNIINSVNTVETTKKKTVSETISDIKQVNTQTIKDSLEHSNDTLAYSKTGLSKQVSLNNTGDTGDQIVQPIAKTSAIFNADYLNNPAPVYPNVSRLRGETGKVLLKVQVNIQGRASRVEIYRSSGSKPLDEAAVRAVNNWNFVPAKVDGNSINSTVIVPIDFKLD